MTTIEMRIIFAQQVSSIFLCLIVVFFLWRQNRKRFPEILLWLADYILQFLAVVLITFRGVLPDFLTIVVAQCFIVGGTIILYEGLCRHVGKQCHQTHNYAMLAIFTFVHIYLTYVYPHIGLRTVNFATALFYICAQGAWLMLHGADPPLRRATAPTGIVFATFCIVNAIQAIANLTMAPSGNVFVSGSVGVIAVLIYETLFVALTFTLFLLVSRRLAMELENELLQHKQTEEALFQSQEKFAKAFQTSPYAIAITRLQDGKFIDVNDAFVAITGYSKEEVLAETSIGLNLWENEKDREEMVSILRQGLPVVGKEYKFRKKNGETLTSLFSAQIVRISEDPCLLSSIEDITERKKAEEAIKRSENFLNALLDALPLPVFYKDDQRRYLGCNKAFEEFFGSKKEQMMGKTVFDMNPPELARIYDAKDKELLESKQKQHYESQVQNKRGEIREVLFNKAIFTDKGGKVKGLIGTILDITDRKKAEETLRESEERYRFIAEHTADHIWIMDMEMHFTYSNTSVIGILGYTVSEFLAKDISEIFTPASLAVAKKILQEELAQENNPKSDPNRSRTLESEHYRKDGKTVWLESSLTFIRDASLKPVGIMGISRDVSERKFAERLIHVRLLLFEFAATHRLDEVLQKTLDEVTALVESPIGFYHFVEPDQKTLSLQAWSTLTVREFCKAKGKGMHYGIDQAGVWVDCVYERRPVIHNDYMSLPHRKGLPEGHAPVVRELVVPIMRGGRIVTILGVGNKNSDYNDKDVEVVSYVADIAWEITERKRAEEELKQREEQVRLLLNSTAEAIYGVDMQGNCTFANPSCLRMLGFNSMQSILGGNMHELIHHSYPDGHPMRMDQCAMMQALREGVGVHRDDEVFWRTDGKGFPVEYWSYPQITNGKITGAVVTFIDITERKQAEKQIQYLATHDALTDLPTLRLAKDRLVSAMNMARRHQESVAVLFVDLDGFKNVNDAFGHDAGDFVLREVAQRLLACVRETDTVARIGGDEFLMVATEISDFSNASKIAGKILQALSEPVRFDNHEAVVGASIGIALFPEHGDNIDQLIKLADEAMYRVKNAGKNGFCFVNGGITFNKTD
jgi:diguanylate cyclase (GGDEF)-like protein/PAS domain S-box-containing protein